MKDIIGITFETLANRSVCDYSRELLKKGFAEDTILQVRRHREQPDLTVWNIGVAATLEPSDYGFRKYRPRVRGLNTSVGLPQPH